MWEIIIHLLTLLLLGVIVIKSIIEFIQSHHKVESQQGITYTHYLLYNEEDKKYIVKEFDDSIAIVGTYYNTQNGKPLLMIQTQGWVPKPNSLGSKISHYQKDTYVITDEYIFTNEQSAILQAIKLNHII